MWARIAAVIATALLAPFLVLFVLDRPLRADANGADRIHLDANGADRMRLDVRANPRILLWGGTVRIECRVPRIATYAKVRWGIEGPSFERASEEQLPGRVVYETLTEMPRTACGTHYAFCQVEQHDRLGTLRAQPVPILVKGLGCPEEEPSYGVGPAADDVPAFSAGDSSDGSSQAGSDPATLRQRVGGMQR
jgi:hypothetical protein